MAKVHGKGLGGYNSEVQGAGQDVLDTVLGKNRYRADAPKQVDEQIGYRMDRRRSAFESYGNPQQEVANAVTDRALGRGGPSVAELQMKRGLGIAQGNAASRAAAGRGIGRGAAQRMGMRAGSDLASQANEQTGMLRAQEQIAAQQLAGQQWRDLRQQELLALGYDLEEAKALIAAETAAQQTNANITNANAANAQGPVAMIGGAIGGAFASSDVRAKEVESYGLPNYDVGGGRGMPSDFTGKEVGQYGLPPYEPPIPQYRGGPTMADTPYLKVEAAPPMDPAIEKQQERLSAFDIGQRAAGSTGNVAQSAKTGFDIGSMLSDEKAKELIQENSLLRDIAGVVAGGAVAGGASRPKGPAAPRYGTPPPPPSSPGYGPPGMLSDFTAKELDDMARQATAFGGPSATSEASDRLAPVQPVGYKYKPEDSADMANEEVRRVESKYGDIPKDDERDIAARTYADKRAPRKGIIAQDLQRSPSMRRSVVQQDNMLAVDRDRALSTALGEMAGLAQEVRNLKRVVYPQTRQPNF